MELVPTVAKRRENQQDKQTNAYREKTWIVGEKLIHAPEEIESNKGRMVTMKQKYQ